MQALTRTLAVTGSTGRLGRKVARRLAAAGVPQRLLVRDPARVPKLEAIEVAVTSYGDAEAARRALDGVDTVFMVSGSEDPDRVRQHTTFVAAAVAAGVSRLVYVSFVAAAPDATFTLARDHWATEQRIRASGLRFTILRDNIYLDFLPLMAGVEGVIRGPAGEGRVAAVAQDDIADVAVAVLRDPGRHDGMTYDLTGREALTLHEVAGTLSEGHGRTVRYQPETVPEAYASRARYNAPDWQVDAWVSTYTAIAAGELAGISDTVDRIAGHPPLTLRELLDRRR
jgi:uncharacterized protein YbjT (DUF2867 family)